jgi:hypothetical protein
MITPSGEKVMVAQNSFSELIKSALSSCTKLVVVSFLEGLNPNISDLLKRLVMSNIRLLLGERGDSNELFQMWLFYVPSCSAM